MINERKTMEIDKAKAAIVFSLLRDYKSIQNAWMKGRKFNIFKAEFEQIRRELGLQNWKKSRDKILKSDTEGAAQETAQEAAQGAAQGAAYGTDDGNITFSPCSPWVWDDERKFSGLSGISEIIMDENDRADVHAMLLENHDDTNTDTGTGTDTDTGTGIDIYTDTGTNTYYHHYHDDGMIDGNDEYVLNEIDSMYDGVFNNSGEGGFDNSGEGGFDNSDNSESEENDTNYMSFLDIIHNQQV